MQATGRKLQGAFSDIQITVEQTIAEGEWVASRWVARMTHRGDQLGVPATGRRVEVTGMSMGRFRGDTMVEGWNNWDQMALMEQIQAGAAFRAAPALTFKITQSEA